MSDHLWFAIFNVIVYWYQHFVQARFQVKQIDTDSHKKKPETRQTNKSFPKFVVKCPVISPTTSQKYAFAKQFTYSEMSSPTENMATNVHTTFGLNERL